MTKDRIACIVIVAGAAWGILGARASAEVAWRSETDRDPLAVAAILEAQRLDARAPVDALAVEARLRDVGRVLATPRRFVVSFSGPLDASDRADLDERGIRILSWLGGGSYFATIDPDRLDPAGASGIGGMRDVEPIRPEWKLHPTLVRGDVPSWAVLSNGADPIVAVYVVFHRDLSMEDARAVAALHGAFVRDELESITGLVIELPESRLAGLVGDDTVQWIEPPLPKMSHTNAENRVLTQVNTVNTAPYSLDGTGVTVMVYDGGTARSTHTDFSGRASVRDVDLPDPALGPDHDRASVRRPREVRIDSVNRPRFLHVPFELVVDQANRAGFTVEKVQPRPRADAAHERDGRSVG